VIWPALPTNKLAFRRAVWEGIAAILARALSALQQYSWPGNFANLRNVIERAAILAEGDWIQLMIGGSCWRASGTSIGGPHPHRAGERAYPSGVSQFEDDRGAANTLGIDPATSTGAKKSLEVAGWELRVASWGERSDYPNEAAGSRRDRGRGYGYVSSGFLCHRNDLEIGGGR